MKKTKTSSQTREKLLDAAYLEVYKNGYNAASTTNILKSVNIPKGSMYHHFSSKKDLVLAVIKERINLKMDKNFDFSYKQNITIYESLKNTYKKMSQNENLIIHGCPLHRLMVEMSSVDDDFKKILDIYYKIFVKQLSLLLKKGIDLGEFENFDTNEFAKYIIHSTWGILSISPSLSSIEQFNTQTQIILESIKAKQK